ncbi:MAG: universal stress protein [Coraliomargaritaceae bacterium]
MTTATILACTDGSIYAPSVYRHAAWASRQMSAGVQVLHMLNPHHENPVMTDLSGSMGFNAHENLLQDLVELEAANAKLAVKRGEAILEDAEVQLRDEGIAQITAEQKHGKLSESIASYQSDADLIVIGKRGNNADFEKGHLGSNLERVIRGCQQPVLVASREYRPLKQFLLAFDGGTSAQKAVDYAVKAPLLSGLACTLLYAGAADAEVEAQLSEAAECLKAAGYEVAIEQQAGEPEEVIESKVAEGSVDLLVMGAYGHSRIRQFIVGSTTTAMIRSVKLPVLLFR